MSKNYNIASLELVKYFRFLFGLTGVVGETHFGFCDTLRVFSGVWYNISTAWSELKKVFAVANPSAGQVNSPSGM